MTMAPELKHIGGNLQKTRAEAFLKQGTANEDLSDLLVRLGRMNQQAALQVKTLRANRGGAFGKLAMKLGFLKKDDLQYALGVKMGFLRETQEHVRIPREIIVATNPYAPAAEEFRTLRTRLLTSLDTASTTAFAVTGVEKTAGAGHVALNLAVSLSQLKKRTLLIDANLEQPTLHKIFGLGNSAGISEFVLNAVRGNDMFHETMFTRLDLVTAGAKSPEAQNAIFSERFDMLLSTARGHYDAVVIATAPFGARADCEAIWKNVGSVIPVARKHVGKLRDVEDMQNAIRRVDGHILGAVVTR